MADCVTTSPPVPANTPRHLARGAPPFESISIARGAPEPLIWMRPKPLHPLDELRCGRRVIATLRYHGLFGTRATGEAENGRWTFEREGLRHHQIAIRAASAESVVGTVELPRLIVSSDAVVHLSQGRSFRWTQFDTSGLHRGVTSPERAVLLRFKRSHIPYPWITRASGEIQLEVAPAAYAMDERPLFTLLGRYLMTP